MPQAPAPNSAGTPQPDNAAGPNPGAGYLPQGKPGGEIVISRAEAAALTAFEAHDKDEEGLDRARRESGLTPDQLKRLRTRADHLRSKGYTLKGQNAIFKPKNYENGDEFGLLGKKEIEQDGLTAAEKRTQRARQAAATRKKTTSTPSRKAAREAALTEAQACGCPACRQKVKEAYGKKRKSMEANAQGSNVAFTSKGFRRLKR